MVSPKTSRAASNRFVLPVSGLGLPPMTFDLRDLHLERPNRRDRRHRNRRQRGSSSSGIVNLWDLPASMTSSRRLPFPIALEIAQRK
jgi:hypothetical protein